ncbi:MAG: hypothetical protein BGO10_09630 [Chlamydia sp. 32-24]|nr:MAG: hypothetical protein BGO10_09630 [Chlamydia sp. 32-24]
MQASNLFTLSNQETIYFSSTYNPPDNPKTPLTIEEFAKAQTEKYLDLVKNLKIQNETFCDKQGLVTNPHFHLTHYTLKKEPFKNIYLFVETILHEKIGKETLKTIYLDNIKNFHNSSLPDLFFIGGFAIEILRRCAKVLFRELNGDSCLCSNSEHPYADIDIFLKYLEVSKESVEFYNHLCDLWNYLPTKYDINFHAVSDPALIQTIKNILKNSHKNLKDRFFVTDNESQYMHLATKGEVHHFDFSLSFNNINHIFTIDAVRIKIPLDENGDIELISSGTNIYQTEIDILSRSLRLTNKNLVNPKAFWKALIYLAKGFCIKQVEDFLTLSEKAHDKLLVNGFVNSSLDMLKEAREKHADNDCNHSLALFIMLYDSNALSHLLDEIALQRIKEKLPKFEETSIYSTCWDWPLSYPMADYMTLLQFGSLLGLLIPQKDSKVSLVEHCEQTHLQIHDKYYCLIRYNPGEIIIRFKKIVSDGLLDHYCETLSNILNHLFFFAEVKSLPIEISFLNDLVEICENLLKQKTVPIQKIAYQLLLNLYKIKPQKINSNILELFPSIAIFLPETEKIKTLKTLSSIVNMPKHRYYFFKECQNIQLLTLGWSYDLGQAHYSTMLTLKKEIATEYFDVCFKYLTFLKEKNDRKSIDSFFSNFLKDKFISNEEKILLFQAFGSQKQLNEFFADFFIANSTSFSDKIADIIGKVILVKISSHPKQAIDLWDKVKHLNFWKINEELQTKVIANLQTYFYHVFENDFLEQKTQEVSLKISEDSYLIWERIYDYKAFSKVIERLAENSVSNSGEIKLLMDKTTVALEFASSSLNDKKKASKKNQATLSTIPFPFLQNFKDFIRQYGAITSINTLIKIAENISIHSIPYFQEAVRTIVIHCNNDKTKLSLQRKILDILLTLLSKILNPIKNSDKQTSLLKTYSTTTLLAIHSFYLASYELFLNPTFVAVVLSYASNAQTEEMIEKMLEQPKICYDAIFSFITHLAKEVTYNTFRFKILINQFITITSKDPSISCKRLLDFIKQLNQTTIDKEAWIVFFEKATTMADQDQLKECLQLLKQTTLNQTEQLAVEEKIAINLAKDKTYPNELFFDFLFSFAKPSPLYAELIKSRKNNFSSIETFYLLLSKYPEFFNIYFASYFEESLTECLALNNETLLNSLMRFTENTSHFALFIKIIAQNPPNAKHLLSYTEMHFEKLTILCKKEKLSSEWFSLASHINIKEIYSKVFFKNGYIELVKNLHVFESYFTLWEKLLAINDYKSPFFQIETLEDFLNKIETKANLAVEKRDVFFQNVCEILLLKKLKLKKTPFSFLVSGVFNEKKITLFFEAISNHLINKLETKVYLNQIIKRLPNCDNTTYQTFIECLARYSDLFDFEQLVEMETLSLVQLDFNSSKADPLLLIATLKCINDKVFSFIVNELPRFSNSSHLLLIFKLAVQKKLYHSENFLKLFFHLTNFCSSKEFLEIYQALEEDFLEIIEASNGYAIDIFLKVIQKFIQIEFSNECLIKVDFKQIEQAYKRIYLQTSRKEELCFWYILTKYSLSKAALQTLESYKEILKEFCYLKTIKSQNPQLFYNTALVLLIEIFEKAENFIPQLESYLLDLLEVIPSNLLNLLLASIKSLKKCSSTFKHAFCIKLKTLRFSLITKSTKADKLAQKNLYVFFEENISEIILEPSEIKTLFSFCKERQNEVLLHYYTQKSKEYFENKSFENLESFYKSLWDFVQSNSYSNEVIFKKAVGSFTIQLLYNNFKFLDNCEKFLVEIEKIIQIFYPNTLLPIAKPLLLEAQNYKSLVDKSSKFSAQNLPNLQLTTPFFTTQNSERQLAILETVIRGFSQINDTAITEQSDIFYIAHLFLHAFAKICVVKENLKTILDMVLSPFGFYYKSLLELNKMLCKLAYAKALENVRSDLIVPKYDIKNDIYLFTKFYFLNSFWNDTVLNEEDNYLNFVIGYFEKKLEKKTVINFQIFPLFDFFYAFVAGKMASLNQKNLNKIFIRIYSLLFIKLEQIPIPVYSEALDFFIKNGIVLMISLLLKGQIKVKLFDRFYGLIVDQYKINPNFSLRCMFMFLDLTIEHSLKLGEKALNITFERFKGFQVLLLKTINKENGNEIIKNINIRSFLDKVEKQIQKKHSKDLIINEMRKEIEKYRKAWNNLKKEFS